MKLERKVTYKIEEYVEGLGNILGNRLIQSEYIRCEYRRGVELGNRKVQRYLHQLGRVPPNLQETMAEEGAYIVFFNGPITENQEMVKEMGVTPINWDMYIWNDIRAGHDPESKAILIGINGNYVGMRDPFLHEFGHSFDYWIGEHFFGEPLSETNGVKSAIETEPFFGSYFQHAPEYVANAVDCFYRNRLTKWRLKQRHAMIYQILSAIENGAS